MSGRDFAVGVVGLGRCGSTMAMAMLAAGGIPPVADSQGVSFELPRIPTDGDAVVGRATKLLDLPLQRDRADRSILAAVPWRFVWLDRNPIQQGKSMRKFVRAFHDPRLRSAAAKAFADMVVHDTEPLVDAYAAIGPVLRLRFEDVLARPATAAHQLAVHVGDPFDVDAAAAAVHDRGPKCLPDVIFETGGLAA